MMSLTFQILINIKVSQRNKRDYIIHMPIHINIYQLDDV